jgi:26S proteasome regulatory subunit N1
LSKYSHDSDLDVAVNAILAMGLVGGGTNNARLAQMLRGLAVYYAKEPDCLFMVRIAQGLVHMGKGTIGINPFFHDRQILSGNAVAGLLALLVSFTNARQFVLGQHHWQLYWLALAMFPQFLITLDEETEEKAVTVRVGQAVNTIRIGGTRSASRASRRTRHQCASARLSAPRWAPTSSSRTRVCSRALCSSRRTTSTTPRTTRREK